MFGPFGAQALHAFLGFEVRRVPKTEGGASTILTWVWGTLQEIIEKEPQGMVLLMYKTLHEPIYRNYGTVLYLGHAGFCTSTVLAIIQASMPAART